MAGESTHVIISCTPSASGISNRSPIRGRWAARLLGFPRKRDRVASVHWGSCGQVRGFRL